MSLPQLKRAVDALLRAVRHNKHTPLTVRTASETLAHQMDSEALSHTPHYERFVVLDDGTTYTRDGTLLLIPSHLLDDDGDPSLTIKDAMAGAIPGAVRLPIGAMVPPRLGMAWLMHLLRYQR